MEDSSVFSFVIDDDHAGHRADAVLAALLEDVSRNYIQKLIAGGCMKVDGAEASSKKLLLKAGQTVELTIPPAQPCEAQPEDIPLDIVYEDDDLIVVNKPPTIAVHESHNHVGDALSNALAYHLKSEGKPCAFRAVGRLDKGTSGIVVCALNKYCAAKLSGKVYKEYLAVASGVFEGEGTIDAPIYRPDPIITKRIVDGRGERAVTHWTAVRNNGVQTLLRIKLETGRTHQIRVHFAYLGAPLVGDTMYGTPDGRITHQALHCCYCKFTHPVTGETVELNAEPPVDFEKLI
jgi:23S rRNA pseudouridine1911/1915/1917 synthase